MKKKMKKVLASFLAVAMMFSTFAMSSFDVSAEGETIAYLSFADNGWAVQYWDDGNDYSPVVANTAEVTGYGQYTVGLDFTGVEGGAPDIAFFDVEISNGEAAYPNSYMTIDSVKVNGEEVAINGTPYTSSDDGIDTRTNLYNTWVPDATTVENARTADGSADGITAVPVDGASITAINTIEVTFTLGEGVLCNVAGETTDAAPVEAVELPAEGTTAYISMADNAWATQYWFDGNDYAPIVATNATVTGYGQYTVGLDFTGVEGGVCPDIVFADVEIKDGEQYFPNSYMTIDSVKINGEEVALTGNSYTSSDNEIDTRTNLYNTWVADATTVENARTADGSAEGITPSIIDGANITNIETIEVTFTLGDGVLCNTGAAPVPSTESYPAYIAIGADNANGEWACSYAGEETAPEGITVVNGELKNGETTTLSLTFDTPVTYTWYLAPFFVTENSAEISPESTFDVKLYLDGVETPIDMTAGESCWAELTGNYAAEQAVRIAGGYNEWDTQYIQCPVNVSEIKYEITPNILIAEVEEEPQYDFDPNGIYHAYLGVQTPTWIFRNAYDDATYGLESGCFGELGFVDGDWLPQGGTFTDVEINGNGTYTVKLEGFDFSGTFEDQPILGADGLFNLLFVSTDLPVNDAVVISNVVVKMDGTEIVTQESAFLDKDSKEVQKVLLANIWNNDIEALPYYAAPKNSIEISFDVSGFANDAVVVEPEAPAAEPTDAPEATEAPVEATEAPAADTSADAEEDGGLPMGVIGAVAVLLCAGGGGAIVAKKKKGTK